ncbi:MAG: DUF4347 domain-containing protein, partial [Gammaproteobacteria bacterium]|nr:DUF4347 domain-containing protein [Gammaproteobacteria bacterium]
MAPVVEALEPRILFSADLFGGALDAPDANDPLADQLDAAVSLLEIPPQAQQDNQIDDSHEEPTSQTEQPDQLVNSSTTAQPQRTELVLVDTATDDYQQLVDDLLTQTDANRHLEVVLLDSERSGIDQISETLLAYQNLDAIHLISHGDDGTVQLGNISLNTDTLAENSLAIALWANSFDEAGDILIYGCNLAKTEVGESLISNLAELTLADVAASDDLTGHASLGGDWELEYAQGQIEAKTLINPDTAEQWYGLLAPPTAADNTISTHEDTTYTFNAANFNYSDADGDAMVSVKITFLASVGDLLLSGADVSLNLVITKADIDADLLTFTAAADGNG